MIIIMSAYHPSLCKVTWFFFPLMRTRVYFFFFNQLWKLQYSIFNYSSWVINVIPVAHLFHNWELVPQDPLYAFCPPTPILLPFGNHQSVFHVYKFICFVFLGSIDKGNNMVFFFGWLILPNIVQLILEQDIFELCGPTYAGYFPVINTK